MKKKKELYPGVDAAEKEKGKKLASFDELPDFIGGKPNYDKFKTWDAEKVLVWLNID